MTLENIKGRLSNYYGFHVYLKDHTPEVRMGMVERMLDAKNANGWTTTPWMNTETGYNIGTFTCSTQYTAEECRGQLVRWHVLQYAYQGGGGGSFHVGWYDWESFSRGGYDTYYYTMMRWLTGATFIASCTNKDTVWTCPLKEASGATALIVWNTAGDSEYTPASEYVDYRYFNGTYGGATRTIRRAEATTIGVIPIMFESTRVGGDEEVQNSGKVTTVCLQNPNCRVLQTWGFTGKYSWIPAYFKGKQGWSLPFDDAYQKKPAYDAMLEALETK
jgi:hypothetical protein